MKALLPVFDKKKKRAYYLQLYDYIRELILTGDIHSDEKLPSLRNFSKSTGLSITTIEQAYNQLLVEGYIHSKPQSGYYVNHIAHVPKETVHKKAGITGDKVSLPTESGTAGDGIISSAKGVRVYYDLDCFDFNKWKKCMNKVINEFPSSLLFESDPQGEESLRKEISRYLYTSRGVTCDPEQIVIGAGTQQITNHLATVLRKCGIEHVALEDPVYMPVRNTFRDRGFAITAVRVADNGLVIEKLPSNIRTAAYVSPSNHISTGAVMPIGRRYELLSWARENDSYIIEDDYDSELRYFGRPIPALKSLDDEQRVIYLSSFSSTLFAAVKIGYMVLPEDMTDIFAAMAGDYSQPCSKLEQLTLAMFMETGNYHRHIKKLRKLYSQKLACAVDVLESKGSDFITVKNTNSGLNVILEVDSKKKDSELKNDADMLGIPMSITDDKHELLFKYNQIPLRDLPKALDELICLWRS